VSHFGSAPALATALIVVQTGILVIGGLITYFSFKAYRRTGEDSLRALAIGFGIITFGALTAGILDAILGVSFALGVLVDASLTLLGFGVITYSLYSD
jgi:hypothetical protein